MNNYTREPSTAFKLARPSDAIIDRLACDPTVDAHEVRSALTEIGGMTFEEALAFVDILHDKRGWSLDTFLAIMEGIDSVRCETN